MVFEIKSKKGMQYEILCEGEIYNIACKSEEDIEDILISLKDGSIYEQTEKEILNDKLYQIKKDFNDSILKGFTTTKGHKYDCSKEDIINIQGALEIAEYDNQLQVVICDYNDDFITLSPNELRDEIMELKKNLSNLFQIKWAARKTIIGGE